MENNYKRNCYNCIFFYVTWEPKFPNGCKALGFKTKQLPSVTVFQSSGSPCELFRAKQKPKND